MFVASLSILVVPANPTRGKLGTGSFPIFSSDSLVFNLRVSGTYEIEVFCQGRKWGSIRCLWAKVVNVIQKWKVLQDDPQSNLLLWCLLLLDRQHGELLKIAYT